MAGHTDIQAYSDGFTVVGCTADVDAVDNTGTTGVGVPIYWLNGAKVADDYADFYDGDWDEEAVNKNELGENGRNTATATTTPGPAATTTAPRLSAPSPSEALGADAGDVRLGRPNSTTTRPGPLPAGTTEFVSGHPPPCTGSRRSSRCLTPFAPSPGKRGSGG